MRLVQPGVFAGLLLTLSLVPGGVAAASGARQNHTPYIGETVAEFETRTRGQAPASPGELTPFLGETVSEFEARKRGQSSSQNENKITLTADSRGHFITTAQINGEDVSVMVDTGATAVAVPYEDAQRLGHAIKTGDFTVAVNTANGKAKVAPVRLKEVRVGNVVVRDVAAVVSEPGALRMTLLGMSFLKRLKSFHFDGSSMTLQQ